MELLVLCFLACIFLFSSSRIFSLIALFYHLRSRGSLRAKLKEKWDMKILFSSYYLRRTSHPSLVLNIGIAAGIPLNVISWLSIKKLGYHKLCWGSNYYNLLSHQMEILLC